jgi:hypothetical protein
MATEPRDASDLRCPVCGRGVLSVIAYDRVGSDEVLRQGPESAEVLVFSCGHEVQARRLGEAARDDPNVERRVADETVLPVETEAEDGREASGRDGKEGGPS